MASHSTRTLLIVAGLGTLAAGSGVLGNSAKTAVNTILGDLKKTFGGGSGSSGGSTAPASAPASGGSGGNGSGSSSSAPDLAKLESANPNFAAQVHQWRTLRSQAGQDPNDWAAFQLFEYQIHAPNPGPVAPAEWPGGI